MKSNIRSIIYEIMIRPRQQRQQKLPPLKYMNILEARQRGIDFIPEMTPSMGDIKQIIRLGKEYTGSLDIILVIYTSDIFTFRCRTENEWIYCSQISLGHPILAICEGPDYLVIANTMGLEILSVVEGYKLVRHHMASGRHTFSALYVDRTNRVIAISYNGELLAWDIDRRTFKATLVINISLGVSAVCSFTCTWLEEIEGHIAYVISGDKKIHVYTISYNTVIEQYILDYKTEAIDVIKYANEYYVILFLSSGNLIMLDKQGAIKQNVHFVNRLRFRAGVRSMKAYKIDEDTFVLIVICRGGIIAPYLIYSETPVIEAMALSKGVKCNCLTCYRFNDDVNILMCMNNGISLVKYHHFLDSNRLNALVPDDTEYLMRIEDNTTTYTIDDTNVTQQDEEKHSSHVELDNNAESVNVNINLNNSKNIISEDIHDNDDIEIQNDEYNLEDINIVENVEEEEEEEEEEKINNNINIPDKVNDLKHIGKEEEDIKNIAVETDKNNDELGEEEEDIEEEYEEDVEEEEEEEEEEENGTSENNEGLLPPSISPPLQPPISKYSSSTPSTSSNMNTTKTNNYQYEPDDQEENFNVISDSESSNTENNNIINNVVYIDQISDNLSDNNL